MAQNTPSRSAARATVPGTANETPVTPPLFTQPSRRDYVPDAKRLREGLATPQLEAARGFFEAGDYGAARREAKRVKRSKEAPPEALMEAQDLLDRTDVDHGPIAAAVAFAILLGLMLMYFATNGK